MHAEVWPGRLPPAVSLYVCGVCIEMSVIKLLMGNMYVYKCVCEIYDQMDGREETRSRRVAKSVCDMVSSNSLL